jgi:putative lipoic acid-binding regulatory protein
VVSEPASPADEPPRPPLLQFPTDYPIKVVGRTSDGLRARLDAIFVAHVPDLDPACTTERFSGNGNFQSISYTFRAVSAAQVTALVTDLKACPDVLIVI